MANNNSRREQVKKESKAITISRENPFSFYYRDLEKVLAKKNAVPEKFKIIHFKAKHAPW
jgi:cobyrinic acid a,c-diamide synthase